MFSKNKKDTEDPMDNECPICQNLRAEIRRLNNKIQHLQDEIKRLQSQNTDLRSDIDALERENNSLRAQIIDLQSDIEKLQIDNKTLQNDNKRQQKQIEELRSNIEKLQTENRIQQKQIEKLQNENDFMKQALQVRKFAVVLESRFLICAFGWDSKWSEDTFKNAFKNFKYKDMSAEDSIKFKKGMIRFFFDTENPCYDDIIETGEVVNDIIADLKFDGNNIAHPNKCENIEQLVKEFFPNDFLNHYDMILNVAYWLDEEPIFPNKGLLEAPKNPKKGKIGKGKIGKTRQKR